MAWAHFVLRPDTRLKKKPKTKQKKIARENNEEKSTQTNFSVAVN